MYARAFFSLVLIVGLVVGVGWLYYFFPHYWIEFKMSNCVGDAVLTWANRGMEKGKEQLRMSMDERGITDEVDRELECKFYEEGDLKIVECEWERYIDVPLVGKRKLVLYQEASATRDGRLGD